jgi:hypothetical protein
MPPDATQHWYVFLDVFRQSLYAWTSQDDEPLGWALATAENPSAAPPTGIMTAPRVAGMILRKRLAVPPFMICPRIDEVVAYVLACAQPTPVIKAKSPKFAIR